MNNDAMTVYQALTLLHEGLERQGPGDEAFTLALLNQLPDLPVHPKIVDLGSGSGVASLLLAKHFCGPVLSVDMAQPFLDALDRKAEVLGFSHLITTLCADMGTLDPSSYCFDLLWSEGAAYALTFEGAMSAWRPLMADEGLAVVSEMSWFSRERAKDAVDFWAQAYPAMADEGTNIAHAQRHGFELLFSHRLPSQAWWSNYYKPLLKNLDAWTASPSDVMQQTIAETRQEIELFERFSAHYGYTFYVLKAV